MAGGRTAGIDQGAARSDREVALLAVELVDVAVARDGRTVWSDATVGIERGEFVAVLGPNAAGKSTLIDLLLGLLRPSAGTVSVLGAPPGSHGNKIGYVPQRHAFDETTRIRGVDIVRLGLDGTRFGLPLPWRDRHGAKVQEAIELVDAAEYARRPIGECSGGEQQRLLIARALIGSPELLLLDEPLDSLDLPNQSSVSALVDRIRREREMTVLLVAHDVNPLLPYVDRVIYVAGGRVLAGPPEQVITNETLTALYQTPIEVLRTSDGRLVVVGLPEAPAHHTDRHAHP
ncbi:MAG TPA: ATP-binding cassette domain-containing protein [Gaiellaceae bacterium]|nr:ATP-binding cassette domain-containing protein [Gaiellaceae bacterium]